ncbi:hypothetical protein [Achromobacter sp.]|jgi:hypothetical protein|uniref:hypothetical protein n=1 Tax=Achromobacter sp. TaxID=134375 RepID=UPI0028A72E6A|nr:hypothetical protein [Achromobacter sp.]
MVRSGSGLSACRAVGTAVALGSRKQSALHVSIFDAFCYENGERTRMTFALLGNARLFDQNLYRRAKTIARPATREYAKATSP